MKKTILITGVTGAIGGATALELAKGGHHLVLLARNQQKLDALKADLIKQTGNNEIETLVADLSDITSIKNAAAEFKKKHNRLDALINVAAIFSAKRSVTKDGLETTFATNHMAPFVLTNELLDVLKQGKPSRVVTVSAPSTTKVNFEDLQGEKKYSAGFMGAFGASKMMNLMFTYALARRLEDTGVTANVFHPGLVKSELTKDMPAFLNFIFKSMSKKPDKAAHMLGSLAVGENYSNGAFYKFNGKEIKSSKYSYDKDLQEKLWKVSTEISNK